MPAPTKSLREGFRWLAFSFLSARRRWQVLAVFGLMLVGGLAELFTLGAIFPILATLGGSPGTPHHSKMAEMVGKLGIDLGQVSLTMLAAIFCVAAIAAAKGHTIVPGQPGISGT